MRAFLVSLITAAITSFLISPLAERYWQRPYIKILGAHPLHLMQTETIPEQPPVTMYEHGLAFILKIYNSSPTPAIVQLAVLDGCVKMADPFAAEMNVPPDQQISFEGQQLTLDSAYDRHKNTVQRIFVSGVFRALPSPETSPSKPAAPLSQVAIPAFAVDYIGVFFPVQPTGAFFQSIGSVSLPGNCSEIQLVNPRPSIVQLLDFKERFQAPNRSAQLRPELTNGNVKLALFSGTQQITLPLSVIKPVRLVSWKEWPALDLVTTYEKPPTGL